jgi:hypothetical protein
VVLYKALILQKRNSVPFRSGIDDQLVAQSIAVFMAALKGCVAIAGQQQTACVFLRRFAAPKTHRLTLAV